MNAKKIFLTKTVKEEDLAVNVKSGSLEVLATPVMIAWMEEAACKALDLEEGLTSVGILMNVSHDLASPLGAVVEVCADPVSTEGRKIHFEVSAFMNGKSISKGVHDRFIVNAEKFLSKVYSK